MKQLFIKCHFGNLEIIEMKMTIQNRLFVHGGHFHFHYFKISKTMFDKPYIVNIDLQHDVFEILK